MRDGFVGAVPHSVLTKPLRGSVAHLLIAAFDNAWANAGTDDPGTRFNAEIIEVPPPVALTLADNNTDEGRMKNRRVEIADPKCKPQGE